MSTPSSTPAPTPPRPPAERIASLDVLRGLGVLGILMVNAVAFAWPWQAYQNPLNGPYPFEGGEVTGWFVTHVFFEMKFITLFTLLFGASLFLIGGERSDAQKGATLRRRLIWLTVFGLIHGALIWYGDILLSYALCGFVVLLCRSWRVSTLIRVGVSLFVIGEFATLALALLAFVPENAMSPDEMAAIGTAFWSPERATLMELSAQMRGGLLDVFWGNFHTWMDFFTGSFLVFIFWRTAGLMLIGIALFKMGLLQGQGRASTYWTWIALGAFSLLVIGGQALVQIAQGFPFPEGAGLYQIANFVLSPLVTLGYIGVVVLLLRRGAMGFIGHALSAAGRMAFSNYIAQSLIMTGLFFGARGLGLFGEATRVELIAIVVTIWVLQLIWSPLWLSKFHYGPLEWVWRKLTYGGAVAFVRRSTVSVA
ncbi:MAG: DUF418 domain-containing protein [Caulobacterales bacterium]|jgi:uncharacterized protein